MIEYAQRLWLSLPCRQRACGTIGFMPASQARYLHPQVTIARTCFNSEKQFRRRLLPEQISRRLFERGGTHMIGNHERIDETFFGNISNRLESSYPFVVHGMNMAVNAVPVEPVALEPYRVRRNLELRAYFAMSDFVSTGLDHSNA